MVIALALGIPIWKNRDSSYAGRIHRLSLGLVVERFASVSSLFVALLLACIQRIHRVIAVNRLEVIKLYGF
jgi:hypothetical protein